MSKKKKWPCFEKERYDCFCISTIAIYPSVFFRYTQLFVSNLFLRHVLNVSRCIVYIYIFFFFVVVAVSRKRIKRREFTCFVLHTLHTLGALSVHSQTWCYFVTFRWQVRRKHDPTRNFRWVSSMFRRRRWATTRAWHQYELCAHFVVSFVKGSSHFHAPCLTRVHFQLRVISKAKFCLKINAFVCLVCGKLDKREDQATILCQTFLAIVLYERVSLIVQILRSNFTFYLKWVRTKSFENGALVLFFFQFIVLKRLLINQTLQRFDEIFNTIYS